MNTADCTREQAIESLLPIQGVCLDSISKNYSRDAAEVSTHQTLSGENAVFNSAASIFICVVSIFICVVSIFDSIVSIFICVVSIFDSIISIFCASIRFLYASILFLTPLTHPKIESAVF
jgi:hypothetical protein